MRNGDFWWELAERILKDAAQYRNYGKSVDSAEKAYELEACAWALISLDSVDDNKNAENIEKFLRILDGMKHCWNLTWKY